MLENRYLRRWREAGLLDGEAAERIAAWEKSRGSQTWLWGMAAMGVFACTLGLIAFAAANWELIPGSVKIAGVLSLNAATAVPVYLAVQWGRPRLREIGALLLFGLVLCAIAVISQVYHLQGQVWEALLTWLVISTPFLAMATRTRWLGAAWAAAFVVVIFACHEQVFDLLALGHRSGGDYLGNLLWRPALLLWLAAMALIVIGHLRSLHAATREQGGFIAAIGVVAMIGAASLALLTTDARDGNGAPSNIALVAPLLALLAGLAVAAASLAARRFDATLAVVAAVSAALWLLPQLAGLSSPVLALLFVAYWALIAWLAIGRGRRGLFFMAFAVILMRLLAWYIEAFGGLMNTGLTLLIGGALCLAGAWLGWKIGGRMAPGKNPSNSGSTEPGP